MTVALSLCCQPTRPGLDSVLGTSPGARERHPRALEISAVVGWRPREGTKEPQPRQSLKLLSACCQTDRTSSVRAGSKRSETPEANLMKTRRFGRKSS